MYYRRRLKRSKKKIIYDSETSSIIFLTKEQEKLLEKIEKKGNYQFKKEMIETGVNTYIDKTSEGNGVFVLTDNELNDCIWTRCNNENIQWCVNIYEDMVYKTAIKCCDGCACSDTYYTPEDNLCHLCMCENLGMKNCTYEGEL